MQFFRFLGLAFSAGVLATPVQAFQIDTSWSRSGVPVRASGYFDPAPVPPEGALAQFDPVAPGFEENGGGIFNEVRLGATAFWQENAGGTQDGVFVTGQVLFDPPFAPFQNWFLDVLLRPRPHLGGSVSIGEGTDQVFGGVTWTIPVFSALFIEASLGGTIHNGELEGAPISLGCRVLFRESVGLGAELGEHWTVLFGVDHSSHAGLCDGENDGLTHIGGSIGYRF